jgi:hypothetical protein
LIALLFVVTQATWIAHHLGHDLLPDAHEEVACEFCLALHSMGAAAPSREHRLAAMPSGDVSPGYTAIPRLDAEPVQPRQQGPPHFS